jgi:hypothetical protein
VVSQNNSKNVLEVLGFTQHYFELPIVRLPNIKDKTVYQVDLPYPLEAGGSIHIRILELHKNRLIPKPHSLPLGTVRSLCLLAARKNKRLSSSIPSAPSPNIPSYPKTSSSPSPSFSASNTLQRRVARR